MDEEEREEKGRKNRTQRGKSLMVFSEIHIL